MAILGIWQVVSSTQKGMNAITDIPYKRRFAEKDLSGASAMGVQWAALQDAGLAVATLAGLAPEKQDARVQSFPAMIRDAGGWRFDLAMQGISDMVAMMEPGVKALLAVADRGQDPTAAAFSLWCEFREARSALLSLVPDSDCPESSQRI